MITTMYQGYGENRIYIHGHLNQEELAAYQHDGWTMSVPKKPRKKKKTKQHNKNGILVSAKEVKV